RRQDDHPDRGGCAGHLSAEPFLACRESRRSVRRRGRCRLCRPAARSPARVASEVRQLSPSTPRRWRAVAFYLAATAGIWVVCALDDALGPPFGAFFGAVMGLVLFVGMWRDRPEICGWVVRGDWLAGWEPMAFVLPVILGVAMLLKDHAVARVCGAVVLAAGGLAQGLSGWRPAHL